MSPQALAAFATAGALWAMVWNFAASRRGPNRSAKVMYILNGVYSIAFVAAWGWLVVHPELDRAKWSEAITPFSLTSFFVVWSGPAIIHFFQFHPQDESSEGAP